MKHVFKFQTVNKKFIHLAGTEKKIKGFTYYCAKSKS